MKGLLDEYGYPFECVEGFDFRFHIRTANGVWRTQVQCYESAKLVRVYMYLNDEAFPSTRIDFVREVVERLNGTIVAGRFVWERGQVRYENGIDFHDRRRSAKAVERVLNAAAFPLTLWNHVNSLIDNPKVDAEAAVKYGLFMEDAVEESVTIKAETLKLALRVVNGDGAAGASDSENIEKPSLSLVT